MDYVTTCWGETYKIEWTGSVWWRSDIGAQSAYPDALLRSMLQDVAIYCGDDPADPDIAAEIDDAIERAELED